MTNATADEALQPGDLYWQLRALVDQLTVEQQLAILHPLMVSLLLRIDEVAELDPVWPEAARAFVYEYQARSYKSRVIQFRRP